MCDLSSPPTCSTWPVGLLGRACRLKVLLPGAVLGDPLAREVPGLDLGEDLAQSRRGSRP